MISLSRPCIYYINNCFTCTLAFKWKQTQQVLEARGRSRGEKRGGGGGKIKKREEFSRLKNSSPCNLRLRYQPEGDWAPAQNTEAVSERHIETAVRRIANETSVSSHIFRLFILFRTRQACEHPCYWLQAQDHLREELGLPFYTDITL